MGSRVRVPSRPQPKILNPCNPIDCRGFLVTAGYIAGHYSSKSLIVDHVKHLPYEEGASMYVSKFICDDKIDYGFVKK